jgi:FMN phosphatase YigB (HAD superfamily)
MVKAVFFDWFNTLARFEPPREELYQQAFRKFGIEPPFRDIVRGILAADRYYFEENAKSPLAERSQEEQMKVYLHYPMAIMAEARLEAPQDVLGKVLGMVAEKFKGGTFVLFDDVLSNLESLKQQELILGLLTNARRDTISSLRRRLGLESHLDFVVTSEEVGADKPKPEIFLAALDKAGVKAAEAVHVGDQYELDVAGARGVGIKPVLIDRYEIYTEVGDCPCIHRLSELAKYLI